jgi:preprotein translocase subunit SecD
MDKKFNWKVWTTVGFAVIAILQLLPTFVPGLPDFYTNVFDKQLSYGLDLKGGLELRYTVDYKRAIGDNTLRLRDGLTERLGEAHAKTKKLDWATLSQAQKDEIQKRFDITRIDFTTLNVAFKNKEDVELLNGDLMNTISGDFNIAGAGDQAKRVSMSDKKVLELKKTIIEQTLQVIRKRVDAFGLVEPDVRHSGDADVDLQLPGLSDRQMRMVRERVGQAAQLTFRMVVREAKPFDDKGQDMEAFKAANAEQAKTLALVPGSEGAYLRAEKKSELVRFVRSLQEKDPAWGTNLMIGYEFIENKDQLTGQVTEKYWRTWNLTQRAELSGDNLARANLGFGEKGEPVVNLEFDAAGGRIFGDLTEKNVGNLMAIMLDEDVSSAPVIREPIRGGRAQITLGKGASAQVMQDEARALVTVLNNGAYKAPVIKVHDIEVGPSLGADAVASGLLSMAVGVLLIIAFMIFYYRQGGLIADFALLLNILLQLGLLVAFNAALTLPGMAGLALVTAMAVDANILIFERIREELRLGRSVRAAVELGYGHAFWTIFDSHLTAGMAGLVLMMYSSGAIYGFAVTLLIGIVTSMFTSIVATRVIYDYLLDHGKLKHLSV